MVTIFIDCLVLTWYGHSHLYLVVAGWAAWFVSPPHHFSYAGWQNPGDMYPPACRSSPQHDSPSFVEGFAFALLDAQLVKEEPNGSLASAVDSRARVGTPCSVQKNQVGGASGLETWNISGSILLKFLVYLAKFGPSHSWEKSRTDRCLLNPIFVSYFLWWCHVFST